MKKVIGIYLVVVFVIAIISICYFGRNVSDDGDMVFSMMMIFSGPIGFVVPQKIYPLFVVSVVICFFPAIFLKEKVVSVLCYILVFITAFSFWALSGYLALLAIS